MVSGALNATLTAFLAILNAVIALGAAGAPIVIGVVETDAGPTPPPFAPATVNVTVVPSVRPEITVVVPGPKISTGVPPDGVTTYPWRQPGGLDVTGAQLTVADISPGATDRFVGAVNVATQPSPLMPTRFVLAGAEQGPTIPAPFVSATVHVMVWLITFSKPVTTIGLDGPVTTRATAPEIDDEQVAVYCAPGSPSPVKLTLTDPMVTKVTDTFVGAFGVAADADVADIVSAPPANRITLAENPNIFLKLRFIVLLEAAAMCPQRDYDVRVATYERYGDTTLTTRCNSKVVQDLTDRTQKHPN